MKHMIHLPCPDDTVMGLGAIGLCPKKSLPCGTWHGGPFKSLVCTIEQESRYLDSLYVLKPGYLWHPS